MVELDHYLGVLERKPGALRNALPLAQARAAGRWPAIYDRLWQELRARNGEARGNRALIDVLLLARDHPAETVHRAVEIALERGCHDSEAVRSVLFSLLRPERDPPPRLENLGALERFERPAPTVADYDALLCATAGAL